MSKKPESQDIPELIDIVDEFDRPLGVMPLNEAHRQQLCHRSVLVLVYGPDRKLYLQKRSQNKSLYPGRYDLSATGHVKAGESREDAARRELREELGLSAPKLTALAQVPASPETTFEFVTLFSAGIILAEPDPNPEEVSGGMYVNSDELAYLLESFREMLTPGLVYFFERGMLFNKALK